MNGGGLLQEDQCIYDSHAKARRQIHSLKFLKYIPKADKLILVFSDFNSHFFRYPVGASSINHAFKKGFSTRYLFKKQGISEGTE